MIPFDNPGAMFRIAMNASSEWKSESLRTMSLALANYAEILAVHADSVCPERDRFGSGYDTLCVACDECLYDALQIGWWGREPA